MSLVKKVSLADIATVHDSKRVPLNSRERSQRKGDVPYYGAQGIIDYIDDYIFDGDYVLIAEDGENLRSRKQPVAFRAKGKFWVNNHAHIVLGNERWLNDYIEAFFHYTDISQYVTGAAQPKLNQANLLKIQIPFVEKTAKESASLWSLLQRKIELNRRINETLEQIGQTLFKHYFVANPESESWDEITLSDIIESVKEPVPSSEVPPDNIYLPIEKLSMKSFSILGPAPLDDAKSSLVAFRKNDVLLGAMRVYFHRVNIAPADGVTRSTVFVLRTKDIKNQSFVCYLLNQDSTIEYAKITSKGSTMPYAVWTNGLADMKFRLPPQNLIAEFDEVIKPILETIRDSYKKNATLTQARDTLLPKLMSGQIAV